MMSVSLFLNQSAYMEGTWRGNRRQQLRFADLLSSDEEAVRLFSVLSSPNALMMLSRLYIEAPKRRTAGVLANICGMARSEAGDPAWNGRLAFGTGTSYGRAVVCH